MKIWKQLEEIGDCVPPLQMIAFFYIFHQGHTKVVQDLRKLIILANESKKTRIAIRQIHPVYTYFVCKALET